MGVDREDHERRGIRSAGSAGGRLPYRSLNAALRERFGGKVYKLGLDIGCTCPNRDGTCGTGGCIFCAGGGTEFAERGLPAPGGVPVPFRDHASEPEARIGIDAMIDAAKARVEKKMPARDRGEDGSAEPGRGRYVAYFQSYTNTYGDIARIGECFRRAAARPDICALAVATRPDCLGPEWIELLSELDRVKPVWVELGLQTIHERTARLIRRGYDLPVFEDAFRRLKEAGLEVVVHVILGLPGEDEEDMRATVGYLAGLGRGAGGAGIDGIKLQLLHVLAGTELARMYAEDPGVIRGFTPDEYADLVIDLVEMLPPEVVIHRLTGDGAKKLLIAPQWSANKKAVLNRLSERFRERGAYQGRLFPGD
ncbi:MAG: TIGR01212 family radical SAM protein [Lachnospiraceae bacterium]|nr:TIGR01212 family radical SAM protein [Lachnospiraceae bacterium]